jgi:hypothetical protein
MSKEPKEQAMRNRNWLDRQLEATRATVGSWSEQKRAALKAQISGSTDLSTSGGREKQPSQVRGEKKISSRK